MHDVKQFPLTPFGMCLPYIHQFFDNLLVGLPEAAVWTTGKLMKTVLIILLEAFDQLLGFLHGDAGALCQFGDGVVI
jgi:hypothetical protein